jgi:hypothetical protein
MEKLTAKEIVEVTDAINVYLQYKDVVSEGARKDLLSAYDKLYRSRLQTPLQKEREAS